MAAADHKACGNKHLGHSHGGGETNLRRDAMPEDLGFMPAHETSRSSFEPVDDPMTPVAHDDDAGRAD